MRATVPATELTTNASPRSGTTPTAHAPVPTSSRPTGSFVSAFTSVTDAAMKLTHRISLRVRSSSIAPAPISASTVATVSSVSTSMTLIVPPSELPT